MLHHLKQIGIRILVDLDILPVTVHMKERRMMLEMEQISNYIGQAQTTAQLDCVHSMIYKWYDRYGELAHKWYTIMYKIYQNKEMELKGGERC